MIPAERRAQILREIEVRGALNVSEFSQRTGLSNMTIRRDLTLLDRQGLLERVYGGAVPVATPAGTAAAPSGRRLPLAVLGMVVPSADYYFSRVIDGARAAAAELGARLILAISDYSPAAEVRQIERLLSHGVDGLLVTPSTPYSDGSQTYSMLGTAGLPVVVVERSLDEAPADFTGGAVRSDHFRGAQLAVQHLVELGHANIGLAWRRSPTSDPVRAGFSQAMAQLSPGGTLVECELPARGTQAAELESRLGAFLLQCRAGNIRAAVMLPDEAAMRFLDTALDQGVRVPRDFSIVAYDDEVASMGAVPMTALSPPKFDVGTWRPSCALNGSSLREGPNRCLPWHVWGCCPNWRSGNPPGRSADGRQEHAHVRCPRPGTAPQAPSTPGIWWRRGPQSPARLLVPDPESWRAPRHKAGASPG